MMRSTPSSIACLRSSGSGAFSLSQAKASPSMSPNVAGGASAFLFTAMMRAASFEATWRTASAPVALMPASISAAGPAATTPMALSGHRVQHRPQPVHLVPSKPGNAAGAVLLNVALKGGIVPVAR